MITTKQTKQFNNIFKVNNTRANIKLSKSLLETLTKKRLTTFERYPKNEYLNLKKYLELKSDIVIDKFVSKRGDTYYKLKNCNCELLIESSKLEYAIINIKTKDIYPNFGYEALYY